MSTYNTEYAKKIYGALIGNGYTRDELGDEALFVQRMGKEANRKMLYDIVQKRGGKVKIGDWDKFNARLSELPISTYTGNMHYVGAASAEPTEMQQMTDAQHKEQGERDKELQRRVDARIAAGDYEWQPIGKGHDKALIEAPKLYAPKLPTMAYNADEVVESSMQRINNAINPDSSAAQQAWDRAMDNSARVYAEDKIKQNAQDALGELRGRVAALSDKYAKVDESDAPVVFNPTTMGGVATKQGYHKSYNQDLMATIRLADATEQMIGDYNARQNMGDWANLGRSLAQSIFDPANWDLGYGDLQTAARVENAVDKLDKGETLTDTEQLLLDAAVNQQVLQAYYNELSGWQQAGEAFGESLPFMAQMAINPLASLGKVAASTVAKKVARHIAKRVSKDALKHMIAKAAGITAKAIGDVAGGYGVAATTGIATTAADAKQRQIGDIQVDFDDNGVARYDGRVNIREAGEAWRQAANNQAFEVISEQMGSYFSPILKGVGKATGAALNKIGMGAINRWIGDFAKKGNVKALKDFFDKTQFHGFAGEYAEEIANGMMNAAFVGDMTMGDVFSDENLIDTAIGLSVMSAIGPTVGTGAYMIAKRGEKKNLNAADAEGKRLLRNAWGDFANAVRNAKDAKELSANLREVMRAYGQRGLGLEEQRAIYNYAAAYNRYKALNSISAKAVQDGVADAEEIELRDLYDKGRGASDKAAVRVRYDNAISDVAKVMGMPEEFVAQVLPDYFDALRRADVYEDNGDANAADALREYVRAKAEHDGMTESLRDKLRAEEQGVVAEVEAIANKKDNNVYEATLRDGRSGYIVDGVVRIDNDLIDEVNSDELLHINIGGRVEQITPDKISKIGSISADEMIEERMQPAMIAYDERYNAMTMPTEQPQQSATVTTSNVQPVVNAADNNAASVAADAARAIGATEEDLPTIIPDREAAEKRIAELENVGDVDSANAIRVYADAMFGATTADMTEVVGNNTTQNILENGNNGAENIPSAAIPVEKRGKEEREAFHLIPVERTIEELYSRDLSQDEIDGFVQANIDEIKSDIEKHTKKQPKMGANIGAYKQAKAEWQQTADDLQQRLDYYNKLQQGIAKTTRESERISDGSDVLQGEQPVIAGGTESVGTGQQGGAIRSDVQGSAEDEETQGDKQVAALSDGYNVSPAERTADAQAFMAAEQANTVDAYQKYLDDYPNGAYRDGARAGVWKIEGINPESYNDLENARSAAAKVLQDNIAQPQTSDQVAEGVQLSDEVDENGRQFVLNSNGSIVFGEIGEDSGLTPAPILLSEGLITNPATNDGYGLVHIEARHGEQIRKAGYKSVVEFVEEVAKNYEVIREGKDRDGHQTYILQLTDKHNNTLMVELSGDGTYWNINTAGIFKTSYGKNRKEVYNRHTTAKQSTETAEASQVAEQGGTQATSSINAPTTSSASEDTTPAADVQEISQESGENTQNGGERMYSQEELAETKEQLGELNATSAPEFAARLFSIKPWRTLEEANVALKELLASYGETLNGQSLAVMPFLDKAQGLIREYNKSQEPRSVEEVLENGDKRITNYNSRGEVATVATERDGKIVSVDSYDEGVLFEHTEYDENGKAASATRYDKQGNAIGTQVYVDGKAVPSETEQNEAKELRKKLAINGNKIRKILGKYAILTEELFQQVADLLNKYGPEQVEEAYGIKTTEQKWNRLWKERKELKRQLDAISAKDTSEKAPKKKKRKSPTTPQELAQEAVAQAEEKSLENQSIERIEDVGEKIGGAKKDLFAENVERMQSDMALSDETLLERIAKLPVSKIFNFDLKKLREGGMPNEVVSFIYIVKQSIPAKPRTPYKVKRWVNNTLALYKLCLEAGTQWGKLSALLNSAQFATTDVKQLFDAYMAVGGFDSGLNIGSAKLLELGKDAKTYEDGKAISLAGKWYVREAGKHNGIYDTKEEAVNALKAFAGDMAGVTSDGKKREVKFAVYRRMDGSLYIAVKGKSDIVIQDGLKSSKEAFDYIAKNNTELQERYRALLDKTKAEFNENRERKGRDYRAGKDVSAEEFRDTFGFRGVEFGNWMKQEDRRKALNECYDALMDLASVCRVSPRALSLNGTLAMAFGARGGGNFSAHYESGKMVINMTKTKGAGALAHEWFHALDNYFARMGKNDTRIYATAGEGMLPAGIKKFGKRFFDKDGKELTEDELKDRLDAHNVRAEMVAAWEYLMTELKKSGYYKRSQAYSSLHSSEYWKRPTELGARAFSVWVENELSKQEASNDYLANNPRILAAEASREEAGFMPYPFDTDAEWMEDAFGNLFDVMQEKTTDDGKVVLYNIADEDMLMDKDSEEFKRATAITMEAVERLKTNGVKIHNATPEQVQAMMEFAEMQKRTAPETVSVQEEHQQTVVSSADGAKVLKDLDNAIAEYENDVKTKEKTFLGNLAKILNAKKHGSNSQYATFEAVNGKVFTIRLANHNAKTSTFDNHDENEGISIVVTAQDNNGITNDGNAHLVEFFYDAIKLRKADGKPLVEILKSIKQALYSGEYRDTTGLAQREEVNIPEMMIVFHGSGAKFDKFDHSYMGTGEGAQAYGWGTYVTEVEGIGKQYAETVVQDKNPNIEESVVDIRRYFRYNPLGIYVDTIEDAKRHLDAVTRDFKGTEDWNLVVDDIEHLRGLIVEWEKLENAIRYNRNLYTVEIPDDNGSNYLHWEKPVNGDIQERVANGLQSIGFEVEPEMNHLTYSRDGKIVVLNIDAKGKDLYAELSDAFGSDKAASEFLNGIGFVGISYPAEATMGGRKDGARNYVIFNENDAQITDRVEFLRTSNGTVYGWTVNGEIYLAPEGINPNTPVHEYGHLWAAAVEQRNPELWAEVKEAMKLSPVWKEVAADENYRNIWNDENRMASEVLSRISGGENYRRTMEQAINREQNPAKKFELIAMLASVKKALADFWSWVKKNVFGVKDNNQWQLFANSVIGDFYKGVNPNVQNSPMEGMFMGERGAANLDNAEEATTRLENLAIAREMESAGKDAKAIKFATGWERGADGKWRYETEDVVINEDAELYDLTTGNEVALSGMKDGKIVVDGTVRLSDLVTDKGLFEAYPELRGYYVTFEPMGENTLGSHDGEGQVIRINRDRVGLKKDEEGRSVRSTLAHEIQHAIQAIEGFARGGNSDMVNPETNTQLGSEGYKHLAGEVESRNVQERLEYSPEERRNSLAAETADVARKDQIFIYDALETSESAEMQNYTAEEQEIIYRAKVDGTYMKAPNGQPTKLTPKQWVQVRTNAFKKWFGDWETFFKKNFLLNGKPVATLTGNEFSRVDGKTLTDQVEEYFKSIGGKAVSPLFGDVILDRKGADDSLAHGMGRNKAVAYAAVKEVIENGVLIDYDVNHRERGYDSAVIAAPININGERYICSVVITRKDDNRFYLHEVVEQKKLSDEGSNTVQGQPQRPKAFAKILQNIISASDNVSKIVDENGEPMVVYHGTENGRFYIFDNGKKDENRIGSAVQYKKLYAFSSSRNVANSYRQGRSESPKTGEKIGEGTQEIKIINTFDPSKIKKADRNLTLEEKKAKYPRTEYGVAHPYGNYKWFDTLEEAERVKAEFAEMEYAENQVLMPVFLSAKDVVEFDAAGNLFYEVNEELYKFGLAEKTWDENNDMPYYRIKEDLGGHDGIIIRNVDDNGNNYSRDISDVVFVNNPNQIKSATENNGEFSTENDDIRFREAQESEVAAQAERVDAEITEAVNTLSAELNTPVEIVAEVTDIPNARKRASKGWYENGKVYLVLPNAEGVEDAVETVLHEVVGHYGLRRLFGDKFNDMLDDVLLNASKKVRMAIIERAMPLMTQGRGDALRVATEEYMAEQAEKGFDDYSLLKRIKGWFYRLLRSMGINAQISDEEIRYMLWRSYRLMSEGKSIKNEIENIAMQEDMGAGEFRLRQNRAMSPTRSTGRNLVAEDVIGVREMYEKKIAGWKYQSIEALQDSMRSLLEFQRAIEKITGKALPDWMNAYYMENAMSSINKAEADAYARVFYKPVIKAVADLNANGMKYEDIYNYIMAKHGIERNREMAVREALSNDGVLDKKKYDEWVARKHDIWKKELSWMETQKELDELAREYKADLSRDYSGLSALFENDFAKKAYELVDAVENSSGKVNRGELIGKLWESVNKATKEVLRKQYDSNMMSRETKEAIEGMYQFYVPLRGFDEDTAEDMYAYMTSGVSPIASMKRAKGRTSKADNPIAWIATMAESAFIQGNRNRMKNAFFNLVMINPNDLVSIQSKVYIEKKGNKWVVAKPYIPDNATPEEINEIVANFNLDMEKKARIAPELFKVVKDNMDIPYVVTEARDVMEHQIFVKRNGKLFVMTVNGNPRLAQAINGLTNPDVESKGLIDKAMHVGRNINRVLSANYTTRNPDFIASNFLRDLIYTNTMTWARESPEYAKKFNVNYAVSIARIIKLVWKYDRGALNMNDATEKMFYDFMMNGGETGYTNLKNVEARKKEMMKLLKSKGEKNGWQAAGFLFDELNRAIENAARFAAFMTSRQLGRSITRSIWDAKEVSVNFNKKGAGARMFNAKGQTAIGNIAAAIAGTGPELYAFWNASIQGTSNFAKVWKRNPKKMALITGVLFALGVGVAWLNDDDDEEERKYLNLPEYVRRSNLVFRFKGMDDWFTIPLPIEFRAIYGMGEYMYNTLMGNEEFNVRDFASLALQGVLPLDVLGDGGGWMAFVPTWAKPLVENINNVNWMGKPIAKETPFNELDPEYKRVYGNVSAVTVEFSKMLHLLGGGDTQTRAGELWEWNPAKIENAISGYLGGVASFTGKMMRSVETVIGDMEYSHSNTPILNRILKSSNAQASEYRINEKYFDNVNKLELYEHSLNGWKRDATDVSLTEEKRDNASKELRKMYEGEKAEVYFELNSMKKLVNTLNDLYKVTGDENLKMRKIGIMRDFNDKFKRDWK